MIEKIKYEKGELMESVENYQKNEVRLNDELKKNNFNMNKSLEKYQVINFNNNYYKAFNIFVITYSMSVRRKILRSTILKILLTNR